MKSLQRIVSGAATTLIFVAAATAAGQAPATGTSTEGQPPPATLTATGTLVRVPVMVQTRAGDPVFTLQASDFALTDDGAPQTVTVDEETGSQPLALVLLVQTGGTGARHLGDLRRLPSYVDAIVGGVEHRVAVVTFGSEPSLVEPFTSDLDSIRQATSSFAEGDNAAAILDALAFSIRLLWSEPPRFRRVILLVSETVDHGSHIPLEEALRSTGDTNTTIYSVAFNSSRAATSREASKIFGQIALPGFVSAPAPPGPPHGCMGKEIELTADSPANRWVQFYDCLSLLAPPLRLAKMATLVAMNDLRANVPETVARQSGGEYAKFTNAKSLERDLFSLSNHLPNQYVLSFQPRSPHPGLHRIGLSLPNHPDLAVTARSSYWAVSTGPAQTPP